MRYPYVLIGGGLAAAAAIEGIREHDREGAILLISRENYLPYHRSALSKEAWAVGYDREALPVHPDRFYADQKVSVWLRREVVEIDAANQQLWLERGDSVGFDHLLFATGCRPRRLNALGAESSSVRYFRDLEDFLDLQRRLERVQHVTVLGGGFTALEMAGTLRGLGLEVTYIFPEEYPLYRLLPHELGTGLVEHFRSLGIETVSGDTLVQIEESGGFVQARTQGGNELSTQLVLVDVGAEAQVELAEAAGLDTDDGIVVDEFGSASRPGFWAAGDVAEFPYAALGQIMRVEGTDHARAHGFAVGANMAGAKQPYAHLPLKWFHAGELVVEGVGELNARLHTDEFWLEPARRGLVFYLRDDVVRGVLTCNLPDRIEWARELIREARPRSAADRAALAQA